jgi:hypothetical protein
MAKYTQVLTLPGTAALCKEQSSSVSNHRSHARPAGSCVPDPDRCDRQRIPICLLPGARSGALARGRCAHAELPLAPSRRQRRGPLVGAVDASQPGGHGARVCAGIRPGRGGASVRAAAVCTDSEDCHSSESLPGSGAARAPGLVWTVGAALLFGKAVSDLGRGPFWPQGFYLACPTLVLVETKPTLLASRMRVSPLTDDVLHITAYQELPIDHDFAYRSPLLMKTASSWLRRDGA